MQANQEIVGWPDRSAVGLRTRFDQEPSPFFSAHHVVIHDAELVGIGTGIALHRESFAAPDQLAATFAKMFPSTNGVIGWLARGSAVPTFHRMDAPAIADDEPA